MVIAQPQASAEPCVNNNYNNLATKWLNNLAQAKRAIFASAGLGEARRVMQALKGRNKIYAK